MRCGYTTGTCACAAAKAAAQMLLSGRKTDKVKVMTPSGVSLLLDVEDISMNDYASIMCDKEKTVVMTLM